MDQLWTLCCADPPDVQQEKYLSSSLFMSSGSEMAPQEMSELAMKYVNDMTSDIFAQQADRESARAVQRDDSREQRLLQQTVMAGNR